MSKIVLIALNIFLVVSIGCLVMVTAGTIEIFCVNKETYEENNKNVALWQNLS